MTAGGTEILRSQEAHRSRKRWYQASLCMHVCAFVFMYICTHVPVDLMYLCERACVVLGGCESDVGIRMCACMCEIVCGFRIYENTHVCACPRRCMCAHVCTCTHEYIA